MQLEQLAFAVELFVIIFSVICWLFYTPVEMYTENNIVVNHKAGDISVTADVFQEVMFPEKTSHNEIVEFDDVSSKNVSVLQYPDKIVERTATRERWTKDVFYLAALIDDLKLSEVRKVAYLLQEKQVIYQQTKLNGKGKTREWLAQLIKDQLSLHQTAVKEVLEQVRGMKLV